MRKRELLRSTGLSDSTVWRMEKDGCFPRRIQLGGNSVGWLESEVNEWIMSKAAARDGTAAVVIPLRLE